MAASATRMSWARRLLVLLAFVLMIGGVVLMIVERDELFLAASVAGFVLVLAAVPRLPRPRGGALGRPDVEAPDADAARPAANASHEEGGERDREAAALAPREWTGNVTVLPRPTGEDLGEAEPAPPEAEPAPAEAEPEPAVAEPEDEASPPPPPPRPAPPRTPRPVAAGPVAPAPPSAASSTVAEASPRRVAVAGAAAGALVWLWRRVRR